MSTNPFSANWTAKGHTLCLGHWEISYHSLPLCLPSNAKEMHMDTYGIFSWLFPDDEDCAEGLPLEQWIEAKSDWLFDVFDQHQIPIDEKHISWFYEAVSKQDWRCGSCGGCL
ncbi:hypothetical protein PN836_006790 [Ningiella sp. W23]|uniref:hypothetical protein n=1 Tax=Ningiella sp. W23 TaxID=3023715 RepID=UPI003757552B